MFKHLYSKQQLNKEYKYRSISIFLATHATFGTYSTNQYTLSFLHLLLIFMEEMPYTTLGMLIHIICTHIETIIHENKICQNLKFFTVNTKAFKVKHA